MNMKSQPRPRRKLRFFLAGLFALVLVAAAAVSAIVFWRGDDGSTYLSGIIAGTLSSEGNKVEIGSVEGVLSSNIVLNNLTMTDRNGVWLKLDRAQLVWNRSALLTGKLSVDEIEIGHLDIFRAPDMGEQPQQEETAEEGSTGLPNLPVKIAVKNMTLVEARLGEPLLGVAARLSLKGMADLGDPSEGLRLALLLERLDAPGTINIGLSFIPETQALSVDIAHDEPAGGLAARLMNIEGLPPVQFSIKGQGILDDFQAALNYEAGEKLDAAGTATLRRSGAARNLDVNVDARIESLLPKPASMLVAGTTSINGRIAFADDKSIAIPAFDITSALTRFRLSGNVSPDRVLDLALTAGAVRGTDGRTRVEDYALEQLELNATVKGSAAAPSIQARLDVEGLDTPEGKLQTGLVTVSAAPQNGGNSASALEQPWGLRADAALSGFVAGQRKLSDATGSDMKLALQAIRREDGVFDIKVFNFDTPTVNASYLGTVSPKEADGTFKLAMPNLAAFSGLAGKELRGRLGLSSRLAGTLDNGLAVDTDAHVQDLSLDTPAADGLIDGALTLKGRTTLQKNSLSFEGIRLGARYLAVALDGVLSPEKADTRLKLDISDLSKVDTKLAGKLAANALVSGTSERPDIRLSVATDQASAMGQPVRELGLEILAKDVLGQLEASLDLKGDIGVRPLLGKANLSHPDPDSWKLENVDFSFGSAKMAGGLTAEKGLADGKLTISANNLDELSALALTKLSGVFNADIVLTAADGKQGGRFLAKGRNINADTADIRNLDADLTATDLFGKPVLNGFLNGSSWSVGGQKIENVALKAQGNASESDITLKANALGMAVDGHVIVAPADVMTVTLAGLSVKRAQRSIMLAKPVTLTIDDKYVTIPELAINANGGQTAVAGKIGLGTNDSDLSVAFRKFPLSVAGLAAPDLEVAGTLDGQAKITGPIATPHGHYDLSFKGVTMPEIRQAGLPGIDTGIKGELKGKQTAFSAAISIGKAGQLTVAGSVPFDPAGNMSVTAKGHLDAAAANSMLSASGQTVSGRVNIDAAVNGRMNSPAVSGQATLANASFTDPLQGIRLTGIEGRISGQGDTIVVDHLNAKTRNNGTISVSGRVAVEPQRGFPGSFKITANRAELVSSELVKTVANIGMNMEGALAQTPRVFGRVDIVSMEVSLPNRLPATAQPLPNARHIAPPPKVRARLEAQKKAQQKAAKSSPFNAGLDLIVSAPNQIFIRGQGVDAEVGGELRITGTSQDPNIIGGFEMRRGKLSIIGQRLDFTRGKLSFSGEMMPELDFLAQTQAGDVTAKVAVTGPATDPSFEISSSPELPRDEVLSRLLFSKSSGSLSPFQALQLAQAVAQLSGAGGVDVFDETRKALGLDSLDITSGSDGGPAVGASRYINDRISVGVRAGAKPEDNAASINVDLTKRLKVKGEVGASGNTSVGVGAEWEY